jgi:hypothetical protein
VYVVWVRRWPTDARSEIDGAGMVDERVAHLWDAGNVIGQPFLDRFGLDLGGFDYDLFLLFDRAASWGASPPDRSAPAPPCWAKATGWPTARRRCCAERKPAIAGHPRGLRCGDGALLRGRQHGDRLGRG